ncbi:thioredoxin family protein [Ruegeria sp. PrR005]|uniref:Thioredoxin fold domain-containing protein n=1 Tax=Ruegeria sp. PrR005 TaxID=2706882 RepID=A0A6B2NS27_9RHOB|nr:thioredoxin family protein [Ruegeria sp. PrR005]NDW45613.1 thioredoxin fold domain-containing protein [Ruegeria sp. PrR005]
MRRLLAVILTLGFAAAAHAVEMGDDGLHKPEWLRDTFKDLQEDHAEARSEGKRLLLLVEQRGCLYCKDMHENTFPDPRVLAMLEETYFPVQINLHGDIEIVDTDGETLTEKEATRKWRVLFTPTMIFLPPDLDDSMSAVDQAVSVMPGAFSPGTTLDMMTWVKEERYLDQSEEDFQRYHARMIKERNDGDTR